MTNVGTVKSMWTLLHVTPAKLNPLRSDLNPITVSAGLVVAKLEPLAVKLIVSRSVAVG